MDVKFKRERLVTLRNDANLSQRELATAVGLPQSDQSRWETGIRSPGLEQVVKLATYFGVAVEELVVVTGASVDGAGDEG